ncbi:MAG: hypothetical protein ACE5QV_08515 [Fidelibacterota bacterium]
MKVILHAFLILLFLANFGTNSFAGKGELKGLVFWDYYMDLTSDGPVTGSESRISNSFLFRRIYFSYRRDLSEDFSIFWRVEAGNSTIAQFGKMTPFIKNAYLKWGGLIPGSSLYIGLTKTPVWSISEKLWGYRSIEKTIADLHKIGSSTDIGMGLKGRVDDKGMLNYFLMIANGKGQKPENNKYKKFYFQASVKPISGIVIVGYGDYETTSPDYSNFTYKAFIGYNKGKIHGGIEYLSRKNGGEPEIKMAGISAFGAYKIADRVKIFGRADWWDPDADKEENEENLFITGLDFIPAKNVNVMPNIYMINYSSSAKKTDIIGRLTLFYKF